MGKILVLTLLAAVSTGCATLREREALDPGHGGFSFVLGQISSAVQSRVSTPITVISGLVQVPEAVCRK